MAKKRWPQTILTTILLSAIQIPDLSLYTIKSHLSWDTLNPYSNDSQLGLRGPLEILYGIQEILKSLFFAHKFIQWGPEIWTSLDFEWSKRGWVSNGPDFEWDLKSRSSTIWNSDNWLPFCQKPFEIQTKTSGFWMVGTIVIAIAKAVPFEIQPSKSSDFKCFPFSKGRILELHCILKEQFCNRQQHNKIS